MSELKVLQTLVAEHLGVDSGEKLWRIENSPLEGRGVFANRDIQVGEVIFKDSPLVSGPRAGTSAKLHCVICMKVRNLKPCSKGCGLPICSPECAQNLNHIKECEFITSHDGNFNEISVELFRALTPIRAIFFDEKQKELLLNLCKHVHQKHGFEVELLKLKINLTEAEERLLRETCYVLDANAFEIMVDSKDGFDEFSLRGLYPIGALLNHSCVPNTTHLFDNNQRMIIKSTVFIPKDAEILTSYTTLLWATAARRHHLWTTKHFYCTCERCKDPKECNTFLSALKCTNPIVCDGILSPLDAMDRNSKWLCDLCGIKVNRSAIGMVQSALGSMLMTINMANPNDLIDLLKNRVHKVVPMTNQIVAELKCRVVWLLGRSDGSLWNGNVVYTFLNILNI